MAAKTEHILETRLIEQFLESLKEIPEAHAEIALNPEHTHAKKGWTYDARIDLRLMHQDVTLLIEAKKSLYPRDVRQMLWQVRDFRHKDPAASSGASREILLLIAESISPGAKELLREERVSYYDSGGSLFLSTGSIYLHIDKPIPKVMSKSIRSIFSKRRAQVLHALLMNHEDWFGVTTLSKQARAAPATVSEVLAKLEKFDWLASRGQGPRKERRLQEPAALLDTWVQTLDSIRPPAVRRYYVPMTQADQLIKKIGQVCAEYSVEYAITREAAGQCYAPFLSIFSQVCCRLLANKAADWALEKLDARTVSEGSNLTIIETTSSNELLFRKQVDGVWLASPVQVYLDLIRGEGRSKEMAEHLRREKIGF